ncbi:hypothetical protein [Lysinibacillus sp. 54212]|uniref:hypothetical protein n=1 Tax=Lysinibacillus sp. 54212 TaxID=3119829 RepID=UPI002FCB2B95
MDKLQSLLDYGEQLICGVQDEDSKYKLMGSMANLYRMNRELDRSLDYLKVCLQYSERTEDYDFYIKTLIRYAKSLKYVRKYESAISLLELALEKCYKYNLEKYEHYAWQHLGKCYLELGDIYEAEKCFFKAYKLRVIQGAKHFFHASQKALEFVSKIKR